jgi:hypothetical protein
MGAAQPLGANAGTLGIGWLRFELTGLYNEDTLMLSYAKKVSDKFSFGANAKYLKLTYGEDQYTLNALDNNGNATGGQDGLFAAYGRAKANYDIDLGVQYKLAYNYRLGLMIENLTSPNLALDSSVSAPLRTAYKFGITHTAPTYLILVDFMLKKFNDSTTDWEASPAGEKRVSNNIALRGALNIGSRELVKVSCGIGYKLEGFEVDYALVYPLSGVQGTMGDHRISVLFRFGPVIRAPENSEAIMKEYDDEKQAHTATKKKLQEARAELERLRRELDEQLSRPVPAVPVVKEAKPMPSPVVAQPVKPVEPAPAAKAPEAKPAEVAPIKAAAVNTAQYLRELNQYRKTASDFSIPQRLAKIEDMIKKYGSELNISEAEQEKAVLVSEQKAQEKYFKDSLDYYRNMARYGIKKEEKMDILKRMINKYKTMGIDVTEAQKEMDKLGGK